MIFTYIKYINIALISVISLVLIQIYKNYKEYKSLFGTNYKDIFLKYLENKFNFFIPSKHSNKYKKINNMLFKVGYNISVNKFIFIKYVMFIIAIVTFLNIHITNKDEKINEIKSNINYGKLSTEYRIEENISLIDNEIVFYKIAERHIKVRNIDEKNIDRYIESIKELIIKSRLKLNDNNEKAARRILQKLIDINKEKNESDDFVIVIIIGIIFYYIPDLLCQIYRYLIEDKKSWETIIAIYTYSIFSQIPPYRTSNIINNISEISNIHKRLFSKVKYGFDHGVGEETIENILKNTEVEDEIIELLETLKLTINIGVRRTVSNIEHLAENAVEWQKIKEINKRNRKYIILIPLLILVFIIGFDYMMYGLIKVISNVKIKI